MRVIAGSARGHPLRAPHAPGVRPTSDLVRGAIFDLLGQYFDADARVLDLYAGSGALGIEALSRGAGWADFVEQNQRCCAAIRENLSHTGLGEQARLYCQTVKQAVASLTGPYALVFMDPPYAQGIDIEAVQTLSRNAAITPDVRLVIEHSRRVAAPEQVDQLHLLRQRRHGDTRISIFGRP